MSAEEKFMALFGGGGMASFMQSEPMATPQVSEPVQEESKKETIAHISQS